MDAAAIGNWKAAKAGKSWPAYGLAVGNVAHVAVQGAPSTCMAAPLSGGCPPPPFPSPAVRQQNDMVRQWRTFMCTWRVQAANSHGEC